MASIPAVSRLSQSKTCAIPVLVLCCLWFPAVAKAMADTPAVASAQQTGLSEDEAVFQELSRLYRAAADRAAVTDAFDKFLITYPGSPRAADAQFMRGEACMAKGLELKRSGKTAKASAVLNSQAVAELNKAVKAYQGLISDYGQSGLEASAQYRIGEAFYNMGDWRRAVKEFARVEKKYPASYVVPESLLGIIYSDIALSDFQAARGTLLRLEENYPPYAQDQGTIFVKAVLELEEKKYPDSQKLFSLLDTPEAKFFLGKAYIYDGKTYLAAGVFETLLKEHPAAELREETEFLLADSFFHARDYDGAIVKYRDFLKNHPSSGFRNAAVFRTGAAMFGNKDYAAARAEFQNVIDKNPRDPFAPLAQYFIAESYLEDKQNRNALFAYTKLLDNYPASSAAPVARYKLAWCRYLMNDHLQAVRTLENFTVLHPDHALAQNALHLAGSAIYDEDDQKKLIPLAQNALYLAGSAWLALAKPEEAVRAFQGALDLAPSSEVAETSLFMILKTEYEMGHYDHILTAYQFIFKSLPPSRSKWRALGLLYVAEAYLARNFIDEARRTLEDILRDYPNDSAAVYAAQGLAWCRALAGDPDSAAKAVEKFRTMEADFPDLKLSAAADAMAVADSYFNKKDFEQAYRLYEKFAAENPQDPNAAAAFYRAGLALYRLRYYSQAVEMWAKLSAGYPTAPEAEAADFQSADTWFRARKYTEALGAYKAVIGRYPGNIRFPLAHLRLAQIHYNMNSDDKALEQAKAVVKNFPASSEAFDALDLAEVLFDRNPSVDFKSFLLDLSSVQPRNKASGEALFRLGRRLFERKDYAGAAEHLEKFSVDYIDHASIKDAQFYLGEAEFQNGEMTNAFRVFNRFTANYPAAKEHPLALFRLGNVSFNLKRYNAAAKAYAQLAELYPDNEYVKPALFNLALTYKNTGAADKAEETYRRYYALSAAGAEGLSALWEIFNLRRNKTDPAGALEALAEIYAAAGGQEGALEALYQLGAVSLENRLVEEARGHWEKLALQKPAGSAWRLQGLVKLGELYEGEKNYAEAARVYEDIAANASAPDVAKAAAERARSLRAMAKPPAGELN